MTTPGISPLHHAILLTVDPALFPSAPEELQASLTGGPAGTVNVGAIARADHDQRPVLRAFVAGLAQLPAADRLCAAVGWQALAAGDPFTRARLRALGTVLAIAELRGRIAWDPRLDEALDLAAMLAGMWRLSGVMPEPRPCDGSPAPASAVWTEPIAAALQGAVASAREHLGDQTPRLLRECLALRQVAELCHAAAMHAQRCAARTRNPTNAERYRLLQAACEQAAAFISTAYEPRP